MLFSIIFGGGLAYGQKEIPVDQTVMPVFTPVTQEQADAPKAEKAFDLESFVYRLDQVLILIEQTDAKIGEARTALQSLNAPTTEGADNASTPRTPEQRLEASLADLRKMAEELRGGIVNLPLSDFQRFLDTLGSVAFAPDLNMHSYEELKKLYNDASAVVNMLPATTSLLANEIRRLEETQARLSNRFRFQKPLDKVRQFIDRLGGLNGNFARLNDALENGNGEGKKSSHAEDVGMPTIDNPGTYIF